LSRAADSLSASAPQGGHRRAGAALPDEEARQQVHRRAALHLRHPTQAHPLHGKSRLNRRYMPPMQRQAGGHRTCECTREGARLRQQPDRCAALVHNTRGEREPPCLVAAAALAPGAQAASARSAGALMCCPAQGGPFKEMRPHVDDTMPSRACAPAATASVASAILPARWQRVHATCAHQTALSWRRFLQASDCWGCPCRARIAREMTLLRSMPGRASAR